MNSPLWLEEYVAFQTKIGRLRKIDGQPTG